MVRLDDIKLNNTIRDGRRRLRLLFITERKCRCKLSEKLLLYRMGSHALR